MAKSRDHKAFNIRLPKEIWKFLKMASIEQERSMNDIIAECVSKYKKRLDNKLTESDTAV